MSEAGRKRRDFIQNLTIALLSVLAVLLFTRPQTYYLGSEGGGYLSLLGRGDTSVEATVLSQTAPLTAPVRLAVTDTYGRYGNVALTTGEELFEPLRELLEQALGSLRVPTACDAQAFQEALGNPSVYCDFLSPLPLPILAELVWTSNSSPLSARALILSREAEGVALYLWDGGAHYYRCSTALSPEELGQTVEEYEQGNAHFAFDSIEPAEQALSPLSLLLDTLPALPALSGTADITDADRLLTLLNFNPNTRFRYADSTGAEVIEEGGRTLRLHTDGTVSYQSGGSTSLTVTAEAETPTLTEAAAGVSTLLNSLLSSDSAATVYLEDIRQSGSTTALRFGYQSGGVPIRFSDGESAAEVTLDGAAVSAMTLRLRQYTTAGTDSLLLPLRQAAAIAARQPGTELSIGYVDSGSGAVSALWLSDEL